MKILINNISILTMSKNIDLLIEKGYIYISDGIVRSIGPGDAPPEYQYAELIINGSGRIAVPGFSIVWVSPLLYPLRFKDLKFPLYKKDLELFYSTLSPNDIYYISTLAFSDLLFSGITSAMVTDFNIDNIVNAALKTGIRIIAAPYEYMYDNIDHFISDVNRGYRRWHGYDNNMIMVSATLHGMDNYKRFKDTFGSEHQLFVYGGPCRDLSLSIINIDPIDPDNCSYDAGNIAFTYRNIGNWRPKSLIGFGLNPSWSLDNIYGILIEKGFSALDILASSTIWFSDIFKINTGVIEPGSQSDIVIYKVNEPPGFIAGRDIDTLTKALVLDNLNIETVIVGKDIVVDNGEILTVGRELFNRAINRIKDIIR